MNTSRVSFTDTQRNRKDRLVLLIFFIILLLALLGGMALGSARLSLGQIFSALFGGDGGANALIITYVRLPRVLASGIAGLALAVAGGVLQTVLNNPLAAPNIIGVNAGSGLFTIAASAFMTVPARWTCLPAFLGALAACLAIYFIARGTGASRLSIILAGVAVSSLLNAGIDTILILFPDTVASRMDYMMGSFANTGYSQIGFAGIFIAVGLLGALLLSRRMEILSLGDEVAAGLGLNVNLYRFVLLVLAALLSGSAVSIAGLMGFVGLIVPHIVRLLIRGGTRRFILGCALLGAGFTIICDTLARVLFAPYELPVGIILSALGAPFFIYLIFNRRKWRKMK